LDFCKSIYLNDLATPPKYREKRSIAPAPRLPCSKTFPPHLVLNSSTLRELKVNTTTRQLLVHLGVSIESVVHTTLLLLIEHNLQDLASILLGAQSLADNLDGVDEVGEDGIVDGGQGSGAGALLRERGARAVGALGAGENAARGEDQDVAVGELLLELTGESLLHAVEALQGRNGDKDDNSLLAVADFNLYTIKNQHASSK